jgi:hypothetical protein
MQILGRERDRVAALGAALGLAGTYIPRPYIEQVASISRGLNPSGDLLLPRLVNAGQSRAGQMRRHACLTVAQFLCFLSSPLLNSGPEMTLRGNSVVYQRSGLWKCT